MAEDIIMKCGIITVYNSENSGSFLQAYAMSCVIKNIGHDVVFVHQGFKGHSSMLPRYLKIVETIRGIIEKDSSVKS